VADSRRGQLYLDWMDLKNGDNFAQKMHHFCLKFLKIFWGGDKAPPKTPYLSAPLFPSSGSTAKCDQVPH